MGGMSTWGPLSAKAQHFSFAFGHYGGHYDDWHHHGWYDHWSPPPHVVYVNPPPPRTVYVVPQTAANQYAAPLSAAPAVQASPNTAAAPRKNTTQPGGRIAIKNASGKGVPVAFLVDGNDVELDDRRSQLFASTGSRIIEFDRGDEFGSARYELTPGNYQFLITDLGWQLVRENPTTPQMRLQ